MVTAPRHYEPFEIIRNAIDDVLNPHDQYEEKQRESFKSFLEGLRISRTKANDFELIIAGGKFGDGGGAYGSASVHSYPAQLYAALPEAERKRLKEYYRETVDSRKLRFPELVNELPEQF